eukprot:15476240-Alexandrium_andersonii.AAC.1
MTTPWPASSTIWRSRRMTHCVKDSSLRRESSNMPDLKARRLSSPSRSPARPSKTARSSAK